MSGGEDRERGTIFFFDSVLKNSGEFCECERERQNESKSLTSFLDEEKRKDAYFNGNLLCAYHHITS